MKSEGNNQESNTPNNLEGTEATTEDTEIKHVAD